METPPPATPPKTPPAPAEHELHEGEYSGFFDDIKAAYDKVGTPVVGILAIAAIVFAGYNLITKNREAALQNAWLDLYGSTTPESLEVVVESTRNPAVRTAANLRAGDLLLAESRTASDEDAAAILDTAAERYQAALDDAPHLIYELNALDGLAVVAESKFESGTAAEFYEQIKSKAEGEFPYWVALAENRLALLPDLADAVVFAPEAMEEANEAIESDAPMPTTGIDLDTPFELAPEEPESAASPESPEATEAADEAAE